jgi:ribosomal protein S12 methylthiotransferase accessory factor
MIFRPRFKHHFFPEITASGRVFLLSETGHFLLQGESIRSLAPLLDGRRTTAEIIEQLRGRREPIEVLEALAYLEQKGYLVEATPEVPRAEAAFWEIAAPETRTAARALSAATVAVRAYGGVDVEPLAALLRALGVAIGDDAALTVVLADDYLRAELADEDRAARGSGRPWLLVKPVGVEPWIGPLFVPGRTGCWSCLAHRLRTARTIERHLHENERVDGPLHVTVASLPSTRLTALAAAATEIARWIARGESAALEGKVVTLSALSIETASHPLTRRPQCDVCGDPAAFTGRLAGPVRLESRSRQPSADGGHRSAAPDETFARHRHHISPVTGVVSRVQRAQARGPAGDVVRCFVASHNFVHMNDDVLGDGLRRGSGGKGRTVEQARTGALAEALERYSGVFQGYEPRVRATLADLGDAGVHPNACMCVSERQFAERERWNRGASRFSWIPERFDPRAAIEWSPCWSLSREERRYVPTACCYYEYAWRHGVQFARADSNGCAAGNNLEEAILQGLMELVERDAVALWWYNRLRRPGVDLASFGEPYHLELCAYYQSLRRDLWVLDLTSDLGVPVFGAVSRRTDKEVEDIIVGFGAHLDPDVALSRAMTELNQSLAGVIDVGVDRPDAYVGGNHDAIRWWKNATVAAERYVVPAEGAALKRRADYVDATSGDLREDVMRFVRTAGDRGLEVLVLDQTRPDIGLSVVKVIAPGLRPFWARFGPGRLYDVPVRMGELAAPRAESELNPYVVYF